MITLTEEEIGDLARYVDWEKLSQHQKLSESFIERYSDKVDWDYIFTNQDVSVSFISKHKEKVNWRYVLNEKKFKQDFIWSELLDLGQTDAVSEYGNFSKKFLLENYSRLNIELLEDNTRLSKTVKKEIELIEKLSV